MKRNVKFMSLLMAVTLMLSACGSATKNGALIGAGGGALLGAIVGKVAGNTAVGAAVGTAVGTGAGVLIGKHMDKVKAEAEAAAQNAAVESITDANGLKGVKVTFDSGILFQTNKSALNATAQKNLKEFSEVLKNNTDLELAVYGHTDNTGSAAVNEKLSLERAQSVANYLKSCGASAKQFATVEGKSFNEPVADNSTATGRAQNRRVELYMYASKEMIDQANAGTLK